MKNFRFWRLGWIIAFLLFVHFKAGAEAPQWIWNSTNESAGKEVVFFRKTFILKKDIVKARLSADADDGGQFFINGKKVASVKDWHSPAYADVTKHLVRGENILAIRGENKASKGGVLFRLELTSASSGPAAYDPQQHAGLRTIDTVVSGTNWLWSTNESPDWNKPDFDDGNWHHAVAEAKLGDQPWGGVFVPREATSAKSIKVMPGFQVELLHSADSTEGSWISMTEDNKGRLIISPQSDGDQLLRVTLAGGKVEKLSI